MNTQLITRKLFVMSFILMSSFTAVACNDTAKNVPPTTNPLVNESVTNGTPNLTFLDVKGKTVSLASLRGKVVFINFWATWCQPCIQEMPSIDQLKKAFKGRTDIVFLMVDVNNSLHKSQAFMDNKKYDLQVYTPTSDIPSTFLGNAIPTTVILDKKGVMASRIEGGRDYKSPEIIQFLTGLVDAK